MKRCRPILAILMSVLTTGMAVAATQHVMAPYAWIGQQTGTANDGTYLSPSDVYLTNGQHQVFTAYPPNGYQVTWWAWGSTYKQDWGIFEGGKVVTNLISHATTYEWTGNTLAGAKAIGVRFDYFPFTVELYKNDGKGTDHLTMAGPYYYPDTFTLVANTYTREGYVYNGWHNPVTGTDLSNQASVSGSILGVAHDPVVKLYAKWTPIAYQVAFNGNGANGGSMSAQGFNFGEAKALSANAYSRRYTVSFDKRGGSVTPESAVATATFNGWAVTASGAKVYNNQQSVQNLTNAANATVTLYANWTLGSVTLPTPTRPSYTFKGWYDAAEGGNLIGAAGAAYTPTAAKTLYAQWTPISYTVSFNGNGGSGTMSPQSFAYGTPQQLSPNAFSQSFTVTFNAGSGTVSPSSATAISTFAGWATTAAGAKVYNNQQSVSNLATTAGATVNLYAKWTSGSVTLPTPTRTGYSFNGWYDAQTGGTRLGGGGATYTPGANKTVYAQWTAISYTVAFNGNGNTGGTMGTQSFTYDVSKQLTANAFSRSYAITFNAGGGSVSPLSTNVVSTFTGWATTADGAKAYDNQQSVRNLATTAGATVNLYAKWTLGTVRLPTPTRTGYSFKGWYDALTGGTRIGGGGDSYTPTAAKTLCAQWTPVSYTVAFDGNGKTGGSMSSQTFSYDTAQKLSLNAYSQSFTVTFNASSGTVSPSSAAAVSTFAGWATTAAGAKVYDDEQSVKNLATTAGATVTLYAKWTPGAVTLPTPTRTGYTFNGWYDAQTGGTRLGGGGASYTPGATKTVYAQWTAISYTVAFDGNGKTGGTMGTQSFTYDVSKQLTANAFSQVYTITFNAGGGSVSPASTNVASTFAGWATTAAGAKVYYNQQSVKNLATTAGATVTLYAKWTSGTLKLPTPIRPSYTFKGWYDASTGGTRIGGGGDSYTPTAAKTLYAQWTPISYTVQFDGNGKTGGSMTSQAFAYDTAQKLSPNAYSQSFTVTFYAGAGTVSPSSATAVSTFAGWATTAAGAKVYDDEQSVKNLATTAGATVTLYAKWTPGTVTLPLPTRANYTFSGWYDASTGGNRLGGGGDPYTPPANKTLYAHWTPIPYQVAFYGNGATSGSMSPQSFVYDTAQKLTKNGFSQVLVVTFNAGDGSVSPASTNVSSTFSGWATTASGDKRYEDQESVKNLTTVADETVKLYAKWTSGTVKLPTPTRANYSFNGWYDAAAGGNLVGLAGASYTPTATKTLYAQWTQKYKARFRYRDSSGMVAYTSYQYLLPGAYATAPAQSLVNNVRGYRFTGWSPSSLQVNQDDLTFEGQYAPNVYYVFRKANDGSARESRLDCTYDQAYSLSNPFERTGYTFGTWNTAIDGSGASYALNAQIQNLLYEDGARTNLYAQWTANQYSVTFDANGGSGTMLPMNLRYDESTKLRKNTFVNNGRPFDGWRFDGKTYADEAEVLNLTTVAGTNLVFSAIWRDMYWIEYLANGGTGEMPIQAVDVGATVALTANAFENLGRTFVGWATNATTAVKYADGASVRNLAPSGETNHLYAVWSNNAYTVSFIRNGGEGSMTNITLRCHEPMNLPSNVFTRVSSTGAWTFKGWALDPSATSPDFTDKQEVTNLTYAAGAVVKLYALWQSPGAVEQTALAVAVDCANLTFTNDTVSGWSIISNATDAVPGVSGAGANQYIQRNPGTTKSSYIEASLPAEAGVLSFHYRTTIDQSKSSKSAFSVDVLDDSGITTITQIVYTCANVESWTNFVYKKVAKVKPEKIRWYFTYPRLTYTDTADVDFVTWTPEDVHTVAVTFRLNDGTPAPDDIWANYTVTSGVAIAQWPTDPAGTDFAGWFTAPSGGTQVFSTDDAPAADTVYYAHWGSGFPVPTEKDRVEASRVTTEGGRFALEFTADENFAYNLLATDSLSPINWYKYLGPTNGIGTLRFVPAMDATQRFFKIETIQRTE